MRVPLYASEPESLTARVVERLEAAGVACAVAPARHPAPPVWDLPPGPSDVLVEHADLPRALEALSGFDPAPVAGRPAAGGSTVTRWIEDGTGWTDALASGPGGRLRLVRRVPITDRQQHDAWQRRVRSELWQVTENLKRTLEGWRDHSNLTPGPVACAPAEDAPSLELVLELTPGNARRLPAVWADGPQALPDVVRAFRTLLEGAQLASGRGLAIDGLHPAGFLLRDDGGLVWGDVGLQRLLRLTQSEAGRPRHPLCLSSEEWGRDPAGAFRLEATRLVRSLLAGGWDAELPPALAPLEALFQWVEAARPETELLEERWLLAVAGVGVCGRCGAQRVGATCPACAEG